MEAIDDLALSEVVKVKIKTPAHKEPDKSDKTKTTTDPGSKITKRPPRQQNRFKPYHKLDKDRQVPLSGQGFMQQIHPYLLYQIKFSNFGELCRITYNTLKVREARSVQFITCGQFTHAMKLCLFARYYKFAYLHGNFEDINFVRDTLNPLCEIVQSNSIPNCIADYIESIGRVTSHFVTVQPYIYTLDEFFNLYNIFVELDEDGNETNIPCTQDNFINQFSIGDFSTTFVRVRTIVHCLRCMQMDNIEGKFEMVIDRDQIDQDLARAKSHFSISESIGKRGACYSFWTAQEDRNEGDFHQFEYRYEGTYFKPEDYMKTLVSQSVTVKYD